MQVIFAGGASGVGASCVAIHIAEQWIVVDAGVRVDRAADPLPDLALLEGKDIKAIFVTHAHADHIGALPLLHRAFPTAPIFTSRATHLLMEIMLADALKIMNKRAVEEMEIPLYPATLVSSMLAHVRTIPVGESLTLPLLPGITIHTSRAGHIAGAMSIGFASAQESIVVSGDLSLTPQRTVQGAVPPDLPHPDLLVLESTYGARLHPNRQAEEQRMAQAVADGLAKGGHVLLPCFGLGRGQEILLLLQAAQEQGIVPLFPIYVDGLIRRVCSAYQLMPEALTPRLARQIRKGYLPFQGDNVNFVRDAKERQKILDGPPACIIASSGMLTGGPSAWYAARIASNPDASILITGYQDEESPGKRLLDVAEKKLSSLILDEREIGVQCNVAKYSLSAHADGGELASYAAHLKPRHVALVHGDEEARRALLMLLDETEVLLPENGDTLDVEAHHKTARRSATPVPAVAPASLPYGIGNDVIFNASHLEPLWRSLAHLPDYQVVTLRELVAVWYGDQAIPEHATWLYDVLEDEQPYDAPYFVPASDIPEAYTLRRTQQESRDDFLRSLVGRVILLRTNPNAAKPVLCRGIAAHETLRVLFPRGESYDRTRFPFRSLLEVIGPLSYEEGLSERETLTTCVRNARRLRRMLSAHELARACEPTTHYTLTEFCELAGVSAHDLAERLAVAKLLQQHPRLFEQYDDLSEQQGQVHYGLAPGWQKALEEPEIRERPDQNWIVTTLEQYIGSPPDLIRRSLDGESGNVTLTFLYPDGAQRRYGERLEAAAEELGVTISISPQTPINELTAFVIQHLPSGLSAQGYPSLFQDRKLIRFACRGTYSLEELHTAQEEILAGTGWSLEITGAVVASVDSLPAPSVEGSPAPSPSTSEHVTAPVEANELLTFRLSATGAVQEQQAITYARERLSNLPGYRKVGIEKATETLRVRFDFPEVAQERYGRIFTEIDEQTGWGVQLYPLAPTQEALVAMALSLIPDGLSVIGRPSIYWDQKTVGLLCNGSAEMEAVYAAQQQFTTETAWSLELQGLKLQTATAEENSAALAEATESSAAVLPDAPVAAITGVPTQIFVEQDQTDRLSQALALAKAGEILSEAQDLYQIGIDAKRGIIWLHFHFPERARLHYAPQLEQIEAQTGWHIELHQRVHLKALISTAQRLLPIDARIVGKPAIYQERQRIAFTGNGQMTRLEREEARRRFSEETGWQLELRIPTAEE